MNKIKIGDTVQIKDYPKIGLLKVTGYNSTIDFWELNGGSYSFSENDLILIESSNPYRSEIELKIKELEKRLEKLESSVRSMGDYR